MLCHVFGDRGLPDIDAELEKLTMYARRAPEWVGDAHAANELSNFMWHPRSPAARS